MNKKEKQIKLDLERIKLAKINRLLYNYELTKKERKEITELKLKTEKYLKGSKLIKSKKKKRK